MPKWTNKSGYFLPKSRVPPFPGCLVKAALAGPPDGLLELAEQIQQGLVVPLAPSVTPPNGTGRKLLDIEEAAKERAEAVLEGSTFVMPYEAGSVEEATTIYKSERMLARLTKQGPAGVRELLENQARSIFEPPSFF